MIWKSDVTLPLINDEEKLLGKEIRMTVLQMAADVTSENLAFQPRTG